MYTVLCNACRVNIYLMTVAIIFARVLVALLMLQERSCYLRVQEFNSTHSHMRSSLAKHIVQRLSSKRVRQIEIRCRLSIDSITKVTYWPRFLLNAYEERHKASYRGIADLKLYTYQTVP